MSEMPVEPRLARCLLASTHMSCELEMCAVAAMCSVEFPYVISRGIDITNLHSNAVTNVKGGMGHDSTRTGELKERLLESMGTFTSKEGAILPDLFVC
jgi:HrpA-like RNA helicase